MKVREKCRPVRERHEPPSFISLFAPPESAYRLAEENSSVPKIPVQPVSYGDAREILR